MTVLPLTRAVQFYPFTDFMSQCGMPLEKMLAMHRLPIDMLVEPDIFIDETRFQKMSTAMAYREGLPELGYLVGRDINLGDLGAFGQLLLNQVSPLQALRVFCAAVSAETALSKFILQREGEYLWFSAFPINAALPLSGLIELYDVQLMRSVVGAHLGKKWLPRRVELQAAGLPPGVAPEFLSERGVQFNSCRTAVQIPLTSLAHHQDASVYLDTASPDNTAGTDLMSLTMQLRQLIRSDLEQPASLHASAEQYSLNVRAMQRTLVQEGTTYRQILAEERYNAAKRLLKSSDLTVTEIAHELGYTSVSNFSRAFRYWAGIGPKKFRTRAQ
jgi:AraC-like DNA-binding protein